MLIQCNAAADGFELLQDCGTPSRCGDAVARCVLASCPQDGLACPLSEQLEDALGVRDVAVGGNFTCAVIAAGRVRCWGDNSEGQLGLQHDLSIGDDELPAVAADVDVGGPVVQLAAGAAHVCALLVDGVVRCWGDGRAGRLGYGSRVGKDDDVGDDEAPASLGSVELGGPALQLAAGSTFTCALMQAGEVRCWGSGSEGKLGILTNSDEPSVGDDEVPAEVPAIDLGERAVAVASAVRHSCAILRSGALRCWGRDSAGELGYGRARGSLGGRTLSIIGDDETPGSIPSVALGGVPIQLSLGPGHSCAVLTAGGVRCWGVNNANQSGYDDSSTRDAVPETLPLLELGQPALQVAVGERHSCALLQDGSVRCWGGNGRGQLGDPSISGPVPAARAPARVDLGGPALKIDAAGNSTCALLATRELVCWGAGDEGNLGYGSRDDVGDDETPASAGSVSVF